MAPIKSRITSQKFQISPSKKYAAFFEKRRGFGGGEKLFFS